MEKTVKIILAAMVLACGFPLFCGCKAASSGTDATWKNPLKVSSIKKGDNIDTPTDDPRKTSRTAHARMGHDTSDMPATETTIRPDEAMYASATPPSRNGDDELPSWAQPQSPEPPPAYRNPVSTQNLAGGPAASSDEIVLRDLPESVSVSDTPALAGMDPSAQRGGALPLALPESLDLTGGTTRPLAEPAPTELAAAPVSPPSDLVSAHPQTGGQPHLDYGLLAGGASPVDTPAPQLDLNTLPSDTPGGYHSATQVSGSEPTGVASQAAPAVLFAPGNINPHYPSQPVMR